MNILTRCKIRLIQGRFNCRRKKWGKNGWKLVPLGGVRRLMANANKNSHLFFSPSLTSTTNFSFKTLPEVQLQNLDQTLCSKSEQKFNFMTKTSASKSGTNCRQHVSKHQHQQQAQPQQVLCDIFTCQGPINQVYLTGFIQLVSK